MLLNAAATGGVVICVPLRHGTRDQVVMQRVRTRGQSPPRTSRLWTSPRSGGREEGSGGASAVGELQRVEPHLHPSAPGRANAEQPWLSLKDRVDLYLKLSILRNSIGAD
jgi:hypothetical protein